VSVDAPRFFDCNAVVGRFSAPVFGNWLGPDELVEELAYAGIAEALITHSYGKEVRASAGNDAVIEAITARPNLHPCWTVFPRHARVDPPEEEQVKEMLARGARAARLHPNPTAEVMDESVHPRHFPLDEVAAGPMLAALEARRIPLLIEMSQARWEEIYAICDRHPSLPVVVLNMTYTHKRSLFAGLSSFPNLHFELSGYHIHQGLEEVCREFGAERMLFGPGCRCTRPALRWPWSSTRRSPRGRSN
jgi:predicted TIM-barrel fold metal-dependent hydrolase